MIMGYTAPNKFALGALPLEPFGWRIPTPVLSTTRILAPTRLVLGRTPLVAPAPVKFAPVLVRRAPLPVKLPTFSSRVFATIAPVKMPTFAEKIVAKLSPPKPSPFFTSIRKMLPSYRDAAKITAPLPVAVTSLIKRTTLPGLLRRKLPPTTVRDLTTLPVRQPADSVSPGAILTTTATGQAAVEMPAETIEAGTVPMSDGMKAGMIAVGAFLLFSVFGKKGSPRRKVH